MLIFAGNGDLTIKCIQECDVEQRTEVAETYKKTTDKELLDDCQSQLSSLAAFAAELLLQSQATSVAKCMKDCLQKASQTETKV